MSITFSPDDAPRGEDTVYECQCAGDDKKAHPECRDCKGTGEVRFKNYMFEVNYSNSNAYPFTAHMNDNGEPDYCGRVEPADVQKVVDRLETIERHLGFMGKDRYHVEGLLLTFRWALANNKGVSWG